MSESNVQIVLHILLIDDEPIVLRNLQNHLQARGHQVFTAERGAEGLDVIRREQIDVVITDVQMPGMDGFEVLHEVRRQTPGIEVIMVTAYGDIDTAVRAMREGAFDFFSKPVKLRELIPALQRTERFQALQKENVRYRERIDQLGAEARKQYGLLAIIGQSAAMNDVRERIEQVCQTEHTTVLITGETGTGKELVARAIHTESTRANGPFVAVDCSSIPEQLIESEFYGHAKGAFTDARENRKGHFEQANGGTLFLDEIGDMDLAMQTRLLRTLEERRIRPVGGSAEIPVDVRVVSATNRNLPDAVEEGIFRKDLYYRLNTFTIHLPPLREHAEDILPLARHFLTQYAGEMRKPAAGFSPGAEAQLQSYHFPGNIRELRNMIERAVILCSSDEIGSRDLDIPNTQPISPNETTDHPSPAQNVISLDHSLNLDDIEKRFITEALKKTEGNRVQAARLLGISRTSLRRRMDRHGI